MNKTNKKYYLRRGANHLLTPSFHLIKGSLSGIPDEEDNDHYLCSNFLKCNMKSCPHKIKHRLFYFVVDGDIKVISCDKISCTKEEDEHHCIKIKPEGKGWKR